VVCSRQQPVLPLVLFAIACADASPAGPRLTAVDPPQGEAAATVPVVIHGHNFFVSATQQTRADPAFILHDSIALTLTGVDAAVGDPGTPLGEVTLIDSQTLRALVPAGIVAGRYRLAVTLPDGQSNTLDDAYQALARSAQSDAGHTLDSTLPDAAAIDSASRRDATLIVDASACADPCDDTCSANACCVQTCSEEECPDCQTGCTCDTLCDRPFDRCEADCREGSLCHIATTAQGPSAVLRCREAATCFFECATTLCELRCDPGAYCELSCVGAEECQARCDDASCLIDCAGVPDCRVEDCDAPIDCGGGLWACNRACP